MQIVDEFICNILSCSHAQANARLIFLGIMHAGVGETHVNYLLAALNVPFAHHKTLKRRERKAGNGLVGESGKKNRGRRIALRDREKVCL